MNIWEAIEDCKRRHLIAQLGELVAIVNSGAQTIRELGVEVVFLTTEGGSIGVSFKPRTQDIAEMDMGALLRLR